MKVFQLILINSNHINLIENTLDRLFDCIYDTESYNYYIALCNYYREIDIEGSNFYLKLLSEEELI